MRPTIFILLLALLAAATISAHAQCEPRWQPFDASSASLPGVNGVVNATALWDPDGSGPQSAKYVAAGNFTIAGDVFANRIAYYDTETRLWSPLGSGMNGEIFSLAVLPNGDLVAGGDFTTAGGAIINRIARWNGAMWSPLGTGMNGSVRALIALPGGGLLAGGGFSSAGGVSAGRIARWDGSAWSPLGSGVSSSVYSLAVLPDGNIVAGGNFNIAGGVSVRSIARWDGIAWLPLGSGMVYSTSAYVYALAVMPNGDLVAAGRFFSAGGVGVPSIARWNGTSWSSLSGVPIGGFEVVQSLSVLPNGDLLIAGLYWSDGIPHSVMRWNDSGFSSVATGFSGKSVTVLPDGGAIAGGSFSTIGGIGANCVAIWNGASWTTLGHGPASPVTVLTSLHDGGLVAGVENWTLDGVNMRNIGHWDGSSWSRLGTGLSGYLQDAVEMPNGDVIAGGRFASAGGVSANRIARWDRSSKTWSPMGAGMSGGGLYVYALAVMPNGDLVAGGDFLSAGGVDAHRIARWDGASWARLGLNSPEEAVLALATLPNGDLVIGGNFDFLSGVPNTRYVAHWDGLSWMAMDTGVSSRVTDFALLPNGDLFAGTQVWNGSTWSSTGSASIGEIRALEGLNSGDLIAGGTTGTRIARWNGVSWSPMGTGMNDIVSALAVLPNGDVVAGGNFTTAGGVVAPRIARWGPMRLFVRNQPEDAEVHEGQTLTLSAIVSTGVSEVGVQWQRNGIPIADGPGGASPDGGVVIGASAFLPSPTTRDFITLHIEDARVSDSGEYTAVFTNPCGEAVSLPAIVTVVNVCPSDYNSDSLSDILDFLDFIDDFSACELQPAPCGTLGDPDFNGDTLIDILDFLDFIDAFSTGC